MPTSLNLLPVLPEVVVLTAASLILMIDLFVGEFLVILAAVNVNFWLGFVAATTMILGAAYTLWMYKRVWFGAVVSEQVAALKDLSRREFWLLATLAAVVLIMGVYPKPFTDVMHVSVTELLAHVAKSKL